MPLTADNTKIFSPVSGCCRYEPATAPSPNSCTSFSERNRASKPCDGSLRGWTWPHKATDGQSRGNRSGSGGPTHLVFFHNTWKRFLMLSSRPMRAPELAAMNSRGAPSSRARRDTRSNNSSCTKVGGWGWE